MTLQSVEKIVKEVVSERFAGVPIESVRVKSAFDEFDDPILRVTIVLDVEEGALDPTRTLGMIRLLRPRLAEIGEDAFPIISYVAKSEMDRLGLEVV